MSITSQLAGKGCKDLTMHHHGRYCAMTQTYNNCAETHLGGGAMSPFVSPLSAMARLSSAGKAHEDSVHIVVIAVVY